MKLTSPAFRNNERLPSRYTGEGANISPPFTWSDVPAKAKELVLICDDPDAPIRPGKDHPFMHWMIYGISPTATDLPEGITPQNRLVSPVSAAQGKNSAGKLGYEGPMPPKGHGIHRYHFKLYALDADLGLRPGISQAELLKAIRSHIIAEAKITGTYQRDAEETLRTASPA